MPPKSPAPAKPDPLASSTDSDASAPLPPLEPPTAQGKPIEDQIAALNAAVQALLAVQQGTLQAMAGVMSQAPVKPSDETLQAVAAAEAIPEAKPQPRIKVVLMDNDNIPPGGQFISVDGVPYLLQPGVEADVPANVLDVLDHAVMSVPVTDENKNVIGYSDRLRFPYRVVRDRERASAEVVA